MTNPTISGLTRKRFFELSDSLQATNSEGWRAIWRERCRTDIALFCSTFFATGAQQYAPFISAHHEFFKWHALSGRNRKGLFLWPRGTAKSTIISRMATVHDILYGREKYILFFSDTATQSLEKLRTIRSDFTFNQKLLSVYGNMRGNLWKQEILSFSNGCIIRASSAGSEVRGFIEGDTRPTKVLLDDVENSAQVISPIYRQKRKDWFNEVIEFIGSQDMNVCIVGTVLHSDCLLADLALRPDFDIYKRKAMVTFPTNTTLWDEWKTIYTNLGDDEHEQNAKEFYTDNQEDMDEGASTLWPQNVKPRYPTKIYELMATRATVGEGAFNKELQNEPLDPERQIFNMNEAGYFEIKNINGKRVIIRADGEKVYVENLTIYGCHDPAGAPNKAGRTDYGAIGIVGRDRFGRLYVLEIWLKRTPISAQITQAFIMCQKWNPIISFRVKTTGTLGSLQDAYRREKNERKKRGDWAIMTAGFVTEHANKVERIVHMEPHITNRWITFNRSLPYEAVDQFKLFPTHTHDDAPDVVHELWDSMKHGAIR